MEREIQSLGRRSRFPGWPHLAPHDFASEYSTFQCKAMTILDARIWSTSRARNGSGEISSPLRGRTIQGCVDDCSRGNFRSFGRDGRNTTIMRLEVASLVVAHDVKSNLRNDSMISRIQDDV